MAEWKVYNTPLELLVYDVRNRHINYYLKTDIEISAESGYVIIKYKGAEVMKAAYTSTSTEVSVPTSSDIFDLVEILHGYTIDSISNQFSGGWADYNDFTTTGAPITITGGAGNVALTNDGLGVNTNITKLPFGVLKLWDSSTNKLDFTGLSIGDWIDIRIVVDVIVATSNTEVQGVMSFGSGGGSFTVPMIPTMNYKTTGTYALPAYIGFYIGSQNMLDNGAQILMSSDKTCTVTVHGWAIKAIKIG